MNYGKQLSKIRDTGRTWGEGMFLLSRGWGAGLLNKWYLCNELEEWGWASAYLRNSFPGRWCNKFKAPVVETSLAYLRTARSGMNKEKIETISNEWGEQWEAMRDYQTSQCRGCRGYCTWILEFKEVHTADQKLTFIIIDRIGI